MNMTEHLLKIVEQLDSIGKKPIRSNAGYIAFCPAHNDIENRSLSINDGDIGVVLNCFNVCSFDEIVAAIGLPYQDFFYNNNTSNNPKSKYKDNVKKEKSDKENKDPRSSKREYKDLLDYCNFKGFPVDPFLNAGWSDHLYKDKYKAIKIVTDGGNRYRLLNNGTNKFATDTNPKFEKSWYKLDQAIEIAKENNQNLIFCNGEPSTVIAQYLGLPAFAICASESVNLEKETDLLAQLKRKYQGAIIIPIDNDTTGLTGALKRQQALKNIGFEVVLVKFNTDLKGYDLADFCKDNKEFTGFNLYNCLMLLTESLPVDQTVDKQLSLPRIITNRQLIEVLPDAINIIATMNKPPIMFRQTNRLVRINEVIKENSFIIEDIDDNIINGILFRGAEWVKENKDGSDKPVYPPAPIVKDIIANPPNIIPELETIITAPAFTEENILFNEPGYNAKLKVFYPSSKLVKFEKFNPSPTETEVAECLKILQEDMLGDFPLASQSDFANTLGTILEQFIKFQIYGCRPLRAFEAATPGTGKGLLVRAICLLCFGREIEATTIPEEKQEWAKLITSLLMEMPEAIFFDNVGKIILSPDLEAVLTAILWKRRLLGTNKTVECYNRALWMVTGNNIIYGGDLPRRVVPIRMVAKQEDPSKRPASDFRHPDLLGWINTNRGLLVRCCLTLVQYWINEGKPLSNYRLGSFESWSTNIGGLLNCLGVKGFLANLETTHKIADPNREYWVEFINQWHSEFQFQEVTVKQLLLLCEEKELFTFAKDHESSHKSKQTKLAAMLRNYRDRIFNNYKIIYKTERDHSSYCLEYIET
jgi:hypothetical protein